MGKLIFGDLHPTFIMVQNVAGVDVVFASIAHHAG
jgi:hypothetical protein